jgi:hypothetical protein
MFAAKPPAPSGPAGHRRWRFLIVITAGKHLSLTSASRKELCAEFRLSRSRMSDLLYGRSYRKA